VELLIGEERAHGAERVAVAAPPLAVEEEPAALRRPIDRLLVAGDVAVEGRVAGVLGPFEGGDGGGDVVVGRLVAEDLGERRGILGNAAHLRDHVLGRLLPHLDGIQDRELRLLLERRGATVPELGGVEHGVHDRRAVALRALLRRGDAVGKRLLVDERLAGLVAGRAGDRVVRREPLVVEELVA